LANARRTASAVRSGSWDGIVAKWSTRSGMAGISGKFARELFDLFGDGRI